MGHNNPTLDSIWSQPLECASRMIADGHSFRIIKWPVLRENAAGDVKLAYIMKKAGATKMVRILMRKAVRQSHRGAVVPDPEAVFPRLAMIKPELRQISPDHGLFQR